MRAPASTIVTGPRAPARSALAAAQEAGDLLQRTLRGGQPDALRRAPRELLEPLEDEREVRAALGGRQRVDLVDDHGLDRRSVSRACEVSIRKSDSGVVIRMSGGCAAMRRARRPGVSPVRMPTDGTWNA